MVVDRRLLCDIGVKIAERKLKRMVNTSHRIEKLLKDSFPMGSGGKGRRK